MKKRGFGVLIQEAARIIEPWDFLGIVKYARKVKERCQVVQSIEKLDSAPPLIMDWPVDMPKPRVGLVRSEEGNAAYWPKFERFLKANTIPYDMFDIKRSDFLKKCTDYDIVVWRTPSDYASQWEAADKIEFMHDHLGLMVMPNKEALWMYEDKVREQWLFEINDLPAIKTFISYSRDEISEYIENCSYPFISKDKTCSSSYGVNLVKNKSQARWLCRKIFYNGLKLHESYIKQKNYVYFQEYVPNKGFDLRVIIVGNYYFGYYRYPKNGDFRASGSGVVEKREIPKDVLLLAKRVKDRLPRSYLLAIDFLQDERDERYYIIETSIFIGVETSEQLVVNGMAGRYIEENGEFRFEEGRFWLQELMMQELMKDWINKNRN